MLCVEDSLLSVNVVVAYNSELVEDVKVGDEDERELREVFFANLLEVF